jgi:cytochrome P450 family 110
MDQAPPGPRRLSVLHMIRAMNDPHGTNLRLMRAYGDPFLVRTFIGPLAVTGHPDGVRDFFAADPDVFEFCAPEMEAPLIGESALVFATGDRHRNDRKLLAPSFHGARMRRYGRSMAAAALREVSRWAPGRSVDVHEAAQTIALEVLVRTVFGLEDVEQIRIFSEAVVGLANAMTPVLLFFPSIRRRFGGYGPYATFLRASERLDALIYREIQARQRGAGDREDILSMMVGARYEDGNGMSDAKLRDELRVLLFAGHETTAVALAWAFYEIHRQPAIRERLLAELDALGPDPEPGAVAALPYLDAVCQETLRRHTIFPEVGRMLRRPLSLRGYRLPAGVAVIAAASILHEREELYPEPHRFRPERFLERPPGPYEFIPFGGGSHRCLGASFATYEMKIVIATLLRRCELRLVPREPIETVRRGITMGPKGGVPMVVVAIRHD